MKILETDRLILREIEKTDAPFILNLLNQPSFIKYIGDRNVRNVGQAEEFIETRYRKSYAENGYGLYLVELKPAVKSPLSAVESIGICGFVKRPELPNADVGFAFPPEREGKGYALEAAQATLTYGAKTLGLAKINAITTQDNERSGALLLKLGFRFESLIEMSNNETLKLYYWEYLC